MEKNKEMDLTSITSKGKGMRFNSNKLRYELIHPKANEDLVKVLTYGANKYTLRNENGDVTYDGSMNWREGLSWMSVIASLKRHIAAIEKGEDYDYDPNCSDCVSGTCKNHSGYLHIAHAACNAHFLNAFYYTFPQGDDRPKGFLKLPKIGLDIDGVLADFTLAWHKLYPDTPAEPTSWYMDRKIISRFDQMREENTLNDFYLNIPPLMNSLNLPFDPYCYITSRPVSSKITEAWLDKLNFPRRPVYTLDVNTSKLDIVKESGIEIFIDDSYDNFVDLNNNGIFTYLFTASWNKMYDVGHMRLNSLSDLPFLK